ncbi:hypothetical protein AGMMS49545_11730 [Betaproteobacteria bacterium]|nr:hypothetical protein AGMMS49545_11730 [Betaproteobacteria bacterium]
MKRSRFGARDRLSRDAAELQRLVIGFFESGSRLEELFWESRLSELLQSLIEAGAEDDINMALDRFYESNSNACDELACAVEAQAESCAFEMDGKHYDAIMFAAPILAWSRYVIPTGSISETNLAPVKVQLGAHLFAREARLALVDYLFSPDQLPRSFCDTRQLLRSLCEQAAHGENLRLDTQGLPETNRFLSDVRYLIGVAVVPRGEAIFRWNEADGNQLAALAAWEKQGAPNLAPLLTGCVYQPMLAGAYHFTCRNADRASRPYAVKASLAFLQATLGLMPEETRAVIAPCYGQQLEEYRIGLAPRDSDNIAYHGVAWALLGEEDEHTDIFAQIDAVLRECGVKDIVIHDHEMPMEFCDDCGAPLFPTAEGELVHAEMPDTADAIPQTLH